jgi:hypothetical protein
MNLSVGLVNVSSQDHRNDVQKGATSALGPVIQALPNRDHSVTNHMADLLEWLYDIHHYACQYMKVANDRMKICCDCLGSSAGFQEGEQVWLNHPT